MTGSLSASVFPFASRTWEASFSWSSSSAVKRSDLQLQPVVGRPCIIVERIYLIIACLMVDMGEIDAPCPYPASRLMGLLEREVGPMDTPAKGTDRQRLDPAKGFVHLVRNERAVGDVCKGAEPVAVYGHMGHTPMLHGKRHHPDACYLDLLQRFELHCAQMRRSGKAMCVECVAVVLLYVLKGREVGIYRHVPLLGEHPQVVYA